MGDQKVISEGELPFRKVRSKPQSAECQCDSFGKRATKALAGVVLTGDVTGAVVGAVADKAIDKFWKKR